MLLELLLLEFEQQVELLLEFVMVFGLSSTVFAECFISVASIQPEAPTHTYIFQAGGGRNWKTNHQA